MPSTVVYRASRIVVQRDQTDSSSTVSAIGDSASFVGNTPSTVLFFIALAVGVLIACLFAFFTVRYFVRSRYGLHIYPLPHRNRFFTTSMPIASMVDTNISNAELQHLIDYVRDHNYIRGDILERRINGGRMSSNGRGGRYSRMMKLTEQEVEILFPKRSYHEWMNGGKEQDRIGRDDVLREDDNPTGDSSDINRETRILGTEGDLPHENIAMQEVPKTKSPAAIEYLELASQSSNPVNNLPVEPHFSSGYCAICLDVIEDEDVVRGLLCGHVFHSACLDPWLIRRKACCPMCKRDYYYKNENENSRQSDREVESNGETNPQNSTNLQNEERNSIDYEAFRNDRTLRALIQELVPISERVLSILNEPTVAHLHIEERARDISNEKYGKIFLPCWWTLMGISRKDLFNWAALKIYYEHRESQNQNPETSEESHVADEDVAGSSNQNASPPEVGNEDNDQNNLGPAVPTQGQSVLPIRSIQDADIEVDLGSNANSIPGRWPSRTISEDDNEEVDLTSIRDSATTHRSNSNL